MQDEKDVKKKKIICKLIGKKLKELRPQKSQTLFAYETGISSSIVSCLERGIKDPQITTLWKISEALGLKLSDFIKLVETELPEGWGFLDK